MRRAVLMSTMLGLAAPILFAQNMPQQHVSAEAMNAPRDFTTNQQTWLNSMERKTKLHAMLAEAWQNMGMAPPAAQLVAAAYDPDKALRIRQVPLRGKSDQEIAKMMQVALGEKRYLEADQILIDYQRLKARQGK